MPFKKIRTTPGDMIVEIKVRDENRSVLENWTIMMSDLGRWTNTMKQKYGIKSDKKKKDEDIDWIYKH